MLPPLKRQPYELIDETVSVLVPSYNHAKYVERTILSIFEQTLRPRILIVIDDGSKDDSPEVIESVLKDAPFPAEFIARENRGLSATLNEGISRVTTTFFAYLGSDDVWRRDFLEKRVALLNSRSHAALAYGNAYSIDAHDRVIDCSVDWARYSDGDVREMLLNGTAPLSPTVVYRTSAIDGLRWNENSHLEDYEFYLRLSVKGEFAFDPEILAAWRQHGANTSEGSLMMMEEKISALYRTSTLFELSDRDLTRLVCLARFRGAQELMRRGRTALAAKHGLPNLMASGSVAEAGRFLGGLAAPASILRRRRQKTRESAFRRYGSFQI